jgi:hypothetical protein
MASFHQAEASYGGREGAASCWRSRTREPITDLEQQSVGLNLLAPAREAVATQGSGCWRSPTSTARGLEHRATAASPLRTAASVEAIVRDQVGGRGLLGREIGGAPPSRCAIS